MIRDFFQDTPILSSIGAIGLLAIVFVLVDLLVCKPKPFWGEIVDKHYEAARSNHGTGFGFPSTGKIGMIYSSNHESEKFLMIVKTKDGEIVTVECSSELYYQKKKGQQVACNAFEGFFTGVAWSFEGVR